ncbi:MAG: gamma-glutamyl-gamma-aminobutyrate hydrolase family protein [Mycobacterium sp.]
MTHTPLIALTFDPNELDKYVLWPFAFQGITAAGATPIAVQTALPHPRLTSLLDRADGLIVGGGVDVDPSRYGGDTSDPLIDAPDPQRDELEIALMATAQKSGKPVLAICRGAQLLNVAHGGTLIGDLRRDRPTAVTHRHTEAGLAHPLHMVSVDDNSLLSTWMGSACDINVNSQHHQGIRRVGEGLRVTARADDGLVEGIEVPGEVVVGVQWHPELLWRTDGHAMNLLRGFVNECRVRATPLSAGSTR